MKLETALNKIKALPDSNTKITKLYNLAFRQMPNSPAQNTVNTEIKKLWEKGYRPQL